MAEIEDLKKEIDDLQKKLSGLNPYTERPVQVVTGSRTVRRGRQNINEPIYGTINQASPNPEYNKTLNDLLSRQNQYQEKLYSREGTYNTLSEQIRALGGGGKAGAGGGMGAETGAAYNEAIAALGGGRNFGASDIATQLNFQVSDEQILNDINTSRINRLNNVVNSGNAQIAGITERLNTARNLLNQLPDGDPRRASSEVVVNQLTSDLKSVTEAVTDASEQIKNFKPIDPASQDALREITAFRQYIQLPEERASQQLRQIDPEAYKTAVGLGRKYRQMATQPLPETTTEPTERLRKTIEQEALNQLSLGATLGAEERRGYEQAVRAAQTARGNIFGLGPAVQEAAQIGAAGEQRKLARYGAAQQFLASGETTGAAQARDLALRDALTQQRLGAAAGFIAGGPSIGNLAQARTQQQQQAMQNYVASAMGAPGGFNMAPSTAQNFYQTTNPEIPVALTAEFNKLYGSQANYQASTYGAQVGAIAQSYRSPGQEFAAFAGGGADILGKVAPFGLICWVAREVYGVENPKWIKFREWILTKASDNLRNYYIKHGEKIAESIRNKPRIKAIIRKWMDSKIIEIGGV